MTLGQINRGSILGEWIYNIVKLPEIINIIDIGTGNGLGTTKCIYDAIIDSSKKNYLVYSIETNKNLYDISVKNLPVLPNFHLLHGYITKKMSDYESFNDSFFKNFTKNDCKNWFDGTLKDMSTIKSVLYLIPNKIDLLILDGGPFSSEEEFNILENYCDYIVLDDTIDIKNYKNYQKILSNKDKYNIIIDNQNERNGYLVCRRKCEKTTSKHY